MKNALLILSIYPIVFLFTYSSNAQHNNYDYTDIDSVKYVVTYFAQNQLDSNYLDFKQKAEVLLFLGENSSEYVYRDTYIFDTTMRKVHNINELQRFSNRVGAGDIPRPRALYYVYKNYPKGKLSFIDKIVFDDVLYRENMNSINWKLENETDTLNNYIVHKASCYYGGRDWTVWYCMDIPYSDGPWKLHGLPGLILKASDSKSHYDFSFISIEKPNKPLMIDLIQLDYIEVSHAQYLELRQNASKNISSAMENIGASKKQRQAAEKNASLKNNPIDLK